MDGADVTCWLQEKRVGQWAPEMAVIKRDTNHVRATTILHWACATREVLYRIVEGLDLLDGEAPGPE